MGKLAFIFPGQGAQYAGMGREFYEQMPCCREAFDAASEAAGIDVADVCFSDGERISQTEYTQIGMIAMEAAILRALREEGIRPDAAAGQSLGEYAALVASGAMDERDAFSFVRKRGIIMQEAAPPGGAMAAILGLSAGEVEAACEGVLGTVSVANYNCPGDTVITGEASAVEAASEACRRAGAARVAPLRVSGPFHSPLMAGAGERLREELSGLSIREPSIPLVSSVTADYVSDSERIREILARQVCVPVLWQQSMERLVGDGVDAFVEIGPGKSLTRCLRKINGDVLACHIDRMSDWKEAIRLLKGNL